MDTREEQAAYIRLGLQFGSKSTGDVVRWADSCIQASDEPSDALIDLSLMGKSHPLDVMGKLGELPVKC